MNFKKITVFLQRYFELIKHVSMVTDLRCFEKLGPGPSSSKHLKSVFVVIC